MTRFLPCLLAAATLAHAAPATELANDAFRVRLADDGALLVSSADASARFLPRFTVLAAERDPKPAARWGEWGDPEETFLYNVLTWDTTGAATELKDKPKHVEDGFDPKSDRKADAGRTADFLKAATSVIVNAEKSLAGDGTITWNFAEQPDFALSAVIGMPPGKAEPLLTFRFTPKTAKWFSVGYTGAEEVEPAAMEEMWQPLVWQEKRFPNLPYLTESGRCTLPGTFVRRDGVVHGVIADSAELPFMPMPTLANSRFGVAVRNAAGKAQPMLFAPILGGLGSKMEPGATLTFKLRLVVQRGKITDAYETLARGLYGFRDYRRNGGNGPLNRTIERAIDYAMGEWAHFNDDLRGCAYDSDVPGAVKNVSALHPLGLALVTDDERIYTQRARPMIEYLLSREKFLFSVNPEVKGQGTSSKLNGPGAPVSELAVLYGMSGRRSPMLLNYAQQLYGQTRTLNLDAAVRGDIWQNSLALYRATGDRAWLEKAVAGADQYLAARVAAPQENFKDPDARGLFFWTSFAPNWMELFEIYEATGEKRFLAAAHEGARRFAQFVWMCPTIPDGDVLANEGGHAPFYRNGPKFPPILIPEEQAPAWRLSEIGLTSESSGTCKGHRGVLLATHGPSMLRIAQATGDRFLHDIGRAAIVGRSQSFPGYHLNTSRSTAYEKPDFAERTLAQLSSTTSLHYNHIWPHIAMLVDFLVADAAYRSQGAIAFPSQFAEGYGYLQERVYGDRPGAFHDLQDAWLWMPKGLLTFDSPEINYVAARSGATLCLALMNQSDQPISATVHLDPALAPAKAGQPTARVWQGKQEAKSGPLDPASFRVEIPASGMTALAIDGLAIQPKFQPKLRGESPPWKQDLVQMEFGGAHGMILNMGPELQSAYVYLQADGTQFQRATLRYSTGGEWQELSDAAFPFDYTVPLAKEAKTFRFKIEAVKVSGEKIESPVAELVR